MPPNPKLIAVQKRVKEMEEERVQNATWYASQSGVQNNRFRTPPKDPLSKLPPELLSIIFSLVRIENGAAQMRGGISRRFQPYTEVNLYHSVTFKDLESLKLFARTLLPPEKAADGKGEKRLAKERREYLALLVTVFKFEFSCDTELEKGWDKFKGEDLFGTLDKVTEISIQYCPPLVLTLTSESCAESCLPVLQKLRVVGLVDGEDAFLIERFEPLRYYATLDGLVLKYWTWSEYDAEETELPPIQSQSISAGFSLKIKSLELGCEFVETTSDEVATFLSHFLHLEYLTLDDHNAVLDLNVVLGKVSTRIIQLSIYQRDFLDEEPVSGRVLSRFPHLEELKLSSEAINDATILSLQVCHTLKKLHLVKGYWGADTLSHFSALKELLRRGARPISLRELQIDIQSGREGQDFSLFESIPHSPYQVGWEVPLWNNSAGFDLVSTFVSAAPLIGITVTGSILEDLRIHTKWEDCVASVRRRIDREKELKGKAELLAKEW